jgi:hypothetical protein
LTSSRSLPFFNTGAGVDALMKLNPPAGVPVAQTMPVLPVQWRNTCYALIRHLRVC